MNLTLTAAMECLDAAEEQGHELSSTRYLKYITALHDKKKNQADRIKVDHFLFFFDNLIFCVKAIDDLLDSVCLTLIDWL